MLFRQFLNEPIAATSYLIGCSATGEAAVVDPGLPAETYALFAADKGLRITRILETHLHADYVSTGRALAELTGARIAISRVGEVRFDHDPIEDGAVIWIGRIAITALHTPGHTPEHTCYVVADTSRSPEPWFVLTGDCLMVGDVGRADLVDLPLTGPGYQYRSIFGKLLTLDDTVEVYPAHYGGSACGGKNMSGKVSSTIGFERRFNWALQAPDQATFSARLNEMPRAAVEDVLLHRHTNQGILPLPPGYGHVRRADDALPAMNIPTLSPREAVELSGTALIDLRPPGAFAAGHPRGALSVPYNRADLAERVAALTDPHEPLVLLADQLFVARAAAGLLNRAGRNHIRGAVSGGYEAWEQAGLPTESLPTTDIDELHRAAASGAAVVLDVRDPYEWGQGVIAGAQLVALNKVRTTLEQLPYDRPVFLVCESGLRAGIAASLLRRSGFDQVISVFPEGMNEYAERYPTERR